MADVKFVLVDLGDPDDVVPLESETFELALEEALKEVLGYVVMPADYKERR
jgi:hypothetical protein